MSVAVVCDGIKRRTTKYFGNITGRESELPRYDDQYLTKWASMNARCHNGKRTPRRYRDRGIVVVDEWRGLDGFWNFRKWAEENGFDNRLTLDRIDNDGPYAPWNCRFVTHKENGRNRKDSVFVEYKEQLRNLSQLCEQLCIPYNVIYARLKKGDTFEQAISYPVAHRNNKPKYDKFSNRNNPIRLSRERANMTQGALAKALGVSQGAVANWENGFNNPTAEKLLRMAAIFGCSIEELLRKEVKE